MPQHQTPNPSNATTLAGSEAVFSLHEVSKRFGRAHVLRDVSFSVEPGDFLMLLGGNGAGKSTLLKIMSSLMNPSKGELRFQGVPYAQAGDQLRRNIGVISHDGQFYGDLTARENLHVFGGLHGVDHLKSRIPEALAELQLDSFPDVPVRAFSSGMLKRLAFARLRLYHPRMLLLDEPYTGLDQASVRLLDQFLERFRDEGGTTVMVTHQFTNGVAFCNRILILNRGTVVYNENVDKLTGERCAALLEEHSRPPSAKTKKENSQ